MFSRSLFFFFFVPTGIHGVVMRNFAVHFIVCCGETSFKFVFLGGLGSLCGWFSF
jgi:hypothetical protein